MRLDPNREVKSRKLVLPLHIPTYASEIAQEGATKIDIPKPNSSEVFTYYACTLYPDFSTNPDKAPPKPPLAYNYFPLVTGKDGLLWEDANIYLHEEIQRSTNPVMATYDSKATDLAAYCQFLEEYGIDYKFFASRKPLRPTYRYHAYLTEKIWTRKLSRSVARRRMATVIHFYRWLFEKQLCRAEYSPWIDRKIFVSFPDRQGFVKVAETLTTDIAVRIPAQASDPDYIDDGEKLRPLSMEEQTWLVEALHELGNTEMRLMHEYALVTGARIQTAATTRVHNILDAPQSGTHDIRIRAGPGTDIDTKKNQPQILFIPHWLHDQLITYANSSRARNRYAKSEYRGAGESPLFLSRNGSPLYQPKVPGAAADFQNTRYQQPNGQAVRQFIREKVIPLIRKRQRCPNFSYRFHDLRATFGMNLWDVLMEMVGNGTLSLHDARKHLKAKMNHTSWAVTERYLAYRERHSKIREVQQGYEGKLKGLARLGREGKLEG